MIQSFTACRACNGPFDPLLDLGSPVLSDFVAPDAPDPPSAPLRLVVCQRCGLVQLADSVDRERLYRQYWYQSGINETMRAELADVKTAAEVILGPLGAQDVIVDVGANDGTFLGLFDNYCGKNRPYRVAYEPALNLAERLRQHVDWIYNDFFPSAELPLRDGAVRLLTSIACFYDLDDPRSFVAEVDRLLTQDGLWIVQMQDLAQMVRANAFDNICHEHRAYYSTQTFLNLLTEFDLALVSVEPRAINGGSLRYYVRRRNAPMAPTRIAEVPTLAQLQQESWLDQDALDRFAWRVGRVAEQVRGAVHQLRARFGRVDLYGASTKASTLLQVCGFSVKDLNCAVERSAEKVGLVTSGTRIPIMAEEDWRVDPAPAALAGIWQFRAGILRREEDYLRRGGTFIFPLPVVDLVTGGVRG